MLNTLVCEISLFALWCGIELNAIVMSIVTLGLLLFIMNALVVNTNLPAEVYRKIPHIITGVISILFLYHTNYESAESFALGMAIVCAGVITRYCNTVSLYGIERKTIGTVLYGLVLAVMALLWLPDLYYLFIYGVLILIFPDALAALIGSRWGKQIPRWNKSVLGSCVFFIATCIVTLFFTQVIWIVLLVALVLTIIEFFSQWGIDNFLLPLTGGFLLLFLL